jgi:enoyl-CoA hydratase/carnithine racemase
MQFDTLLFERRDGIAYVTLNRPDRLNALNLGLITDLGRRVRRAWPCWATH